MRIQDFKSRYEGIPFTTSTRDYKKNTVKLNFEQLSHMHKEMELLLVLEGKAKLYVENTPFNITKGDIVIMPPFTLHRYTILSDYDFNHYCMCFDSDILYDKTFASAIEDGSITVKNIIQQNEKCAELIKEAFRVFKEKKPGWELQVVGNMSLIFGIFIELGYFEKHRVDAENYIFPKIFSYLGTQTHYRIGKIGSYGPHSS